MEPNQDVVMDAPDGGIFQSNLPLREKLDRARTELLDLSARNRLLNMPRGARGARSIEVIDEKAGEVFRLLVREGKTFTFLAGRAAEGEESAPDAVQESDEVAQLMQPEDESMDERGILRRHSDTRLQTRLTSKGLQKRLLELYFDSRTLEEEQGVNVLFLTLGALKWVDPHNAANVRHAPLLLVPVQLDRGNAGERFHLRVRQEDFAANLSLETFLDRVHALQMPEFDPGEGFDPVGYFDQVSQCIRDKASWEVLPDDMSVGFFSFAKFLMYRDLDPAVWPPGATISDHPLVRSALSEGFAADDGMVHEDANIDEIIPPPEMVHILNCDSSQALAIHEVRQGKNLVIQGPPGTGKSQTIANIIAAAIKDGKTVLFVAEKMAALEVVKRRLDETGVGDACLELHSNKANKRSVLEELRRTWELGAPKANDPTRLFARLTETRDELNAHPRRLHEVDSCSGLSPYQVQGHLTRLRARGEKPNDLQLYEPETWGREGFLSRHALLQDLAHRVEEIGKPADHAWLGVGLEAITPMDQDRLNKRILALAEHLEATRPTLEAMALLLEREPPRRFSDVPELINLLRRIAMAPALSARAMGHVVWDRVEEIRTLLEAGRQYEAQRKALGAMVTEGAWRENLHETTAAFQELPVAFAQEQFGRLVQLSEMLPHLVAEASGLARALGREPGETMADFGMLVRIGERVATAPPASPETFASDLWDSGIDRAGDLAGAVLTLEGARNEIATQVTEMAWTTDLGPARAVLAARGTGMLRFLSGEWRQANRLVRSVVAHPDQPLPVTLSVLDTLARGQSARRIIESEDAFGRSAFGNDWRGERSNSRPLLALVEWMRSLKGLGAEPRLIASRSPEKAEIAERSRKLAALCAKVAPVLRSVGEDLAEVKASPFGEQSSPDRIVLKAVFQALLRYTEANSVARGILLAPPGSVGEVRRVLLALAEGQVAQQAVEEAESLGAAAFDEAWKGVQSPWDVLDAATTWMEVNADIRALAGRVGQRDGLLQPATNIEASRAHALTEIQALCDELKLDIQASLGGAPDDVLLDLLSWRLRRWAQESERIFQWVNYRDRSARAVRQGCSDVVARLGDGRLAPHQVLTAFEMAYFEATYGRLVRRTPDLGRFDGTTHARLVEDFSKLDQDRISAARFEVAQAHYAGVPKREGAMGPLGVLRGEIQKKRGHLPLRKLVEKAGPAVRALKPVFMMSPLSVAQFLPPGAMKFDLLVMDEASQIQPVDALGAIARANQVVVVGDPKQLPPTSFFAKMTASDDEEEDDGAAVVAVESILGLFMARGLPKRMLRWHYRSRHQSLIAVSNHQFYENKLYIVPSPYTALGGMGLRFRHVPEGLFDTGVKRNNLIEAKVVAQAIIEHARTSPRLSLGVAAFSAAQRRAIMDELELLRRSISPEVESFFNQHPTEPFFVKNLENVQGDERDVIFISVGYGRSVPGGRVPMRFGPLGTDGGERRLNVLISRAKRRCEVFASMTDEDIDPSYAAGKKGVASFRMFLKYARTGHMPTAEVTGRDHDSIFEEQVCDALRARGYEVQPQVGIAGFFIDLAIVDPERPGRYVLGIECDGATYHSSRWARDRDRLRQMILEEHGWAIHRIWSTDWFQQPSEQLDRVVRRVDALMADLRESEENRVDLPPPAEEVIIEREGGGEDAGAEGSSFQPYQEVALSLPRGCTTELHETSLHILTDLVIQAISIEGPVHVDHVTTRVREAWGLKRSGLRIETAVDQAIGLAIQSKRVTREHDFLWLTGMAPTPRDRGNVGATVLRRAEMLPPSEVEAAASQLLAQSYGASREEVIQGVARGLGIRNTSSQVRSVIEKVVIQMVRKGRLMEADGLIKFATTNG